MKITDKAITWLLGDMIKKGVEERMSAASSSLSAPSTEDLKWRKLTGNAERDLLPVTQDRMIEIAFYLYETNPLAGWLVDVTTAFILAEGLPFEAASQDVREVLNAFWNDPVNRMPLYFPKHVNELQVFGELCFPAFTAQQTGRVRLGYVDPANIDAVITDPENVRMVLGVTTKPWSGLIGGDTYATPAKMYRAILPEDGEFILSATARQIREHLGDGECFYWGINNVTNSPRGRSSFLAVADWLDVYEQFLFDYSDKWPQFNSFVWDLTVTGEDKKAINEHLANFKKKPGSVFGHNEKVKLEAVTPDLRTADAKEGARLFRNHIMGRWGFPEHWYGGGGEVTRATASEMDLPALKIMSQKQLAVKYIIQDMGNCQISKARAARYLRVADEDAVFSIIAPEMSTKDIAKSSTAAQQMATACVTAEMQGWVDKDTARRIFASVISFTGVDMDFDEIKTRLEQEEAAKGYDDYKKTDGGGMENEGRGKIQVVK